MLAQLEVSSEKCSVFLFEFITESLHCVLVDKSTGCLTLCVDGTGYVTEAFAHIIADRVNVAVSSAAAVFDVCLCAIETIFYRSLCAVEAVFEAVVDCVEAITESIGDATELSVYILIVESFEEVGASESTLYSGVATSEAISEQSTSTKYG